MSEVVIEIFDFAKQGGEEGLKKAITETCVKVHANAVPSAPFDLGALRNSIMFITPWDGEVLFNSQPGKNAEGKDKLTVSVSGLEGAVGTNIDYGTYQEFGTKNMPAQPYMRPAGMAVRGATAQQIGEKYGREAMEKEFAQRKKSTKRFKS